MNSTLVKCASMAYQASVAGRALQVGAAIFANPAMWTAASASLALPVTSPIVFGTMALTTGLATGAVGAAGATPYGAVSLFNYLFSPSDSDSTPQQGVNVVVPTDNMSVDEALVAMGNVEFSE